MRRDVRHVFPRGLRSIRPYGFWHRAARTKRLRIQCHGGGPAQFGASTLLPALSLLSPADAGGQGDDAGLSPARAAGGAHSGQFNI
ncbi:MAG: hypothetical protein JNK85_11310 [Verrucomicrobiales bacterium]|nr:hypothetical protein [Verrucomicrobiales bacterium]